MPTFKANSATGASRPMRRRALQSTGALGTGRTPVSSMKRDPLATLASLGRRAVSSSDLSTINGIDTSNRRRVFDRRRTARIGSLFRSEHMVLLRLYFSRQAAYDTVDELGELGLCEFRDLNANQSAFQRTFSENVRRCDDMLRVVRFLTEKIVEDGTLTLAPSAPDRAATVRLDDLDTHLRSLEVDLLEMGANADKLQTQYNELLELRRVLEKAGEFFHAAPTTATRASARKQYMGPADNADLVSGFFDGMAALSASPAILVSNDPNGSTDNFQENQLPNLLSFFTGTISREKIASFERVLFRATHGNCIVRFSELKEQLVDPATREKMDKSVFMVFFSGKAIRAKVAKICDAFDANRYSIPEDSGLQMSACQECKTRLNDLEAIIATSKSHALEILREVSSNLLTWKEKIRRDMGVFHTLNLLNYDMSNQLFLAEVWVPDSAQEDLRNALEIGRRRSNSQIPSLIEEKPLEDDDVPPTYYKTNKFTEIFQSIVESYGVATYQEVNPAPYTVITFPFLFAVMFGDIGHGFIMALFSLYVVLNERRYKAQGNRLNEFMKTVYQGRYLLLMMGIFSIYTGFIYNEFFAVPLDIFGSRWKWTSASKMACGIDNCDTDPAAVMPPVAPYPFGFDPVWKGSSTGLVFFNSYKMKLSIVLGVSQMLLGLWLSKVNANYFKNRLDFLYVFIPQMIFMTSIFGYLVFLIILKWSIDFNAPACRADPTCVPPDLKSILIGMFMSPGKLEPEMTMFRGQNTVQKLLLGSALISVPWMLLPKPLILRARNMKRRGYRPVSSTEDGESLLPSGTDDDEERPKAQFDFTEVFVNQMIHTIEFVLGSVSNTASYLRLWALSLAHAELSDVFLEKLLYRAIETHKPVAMVIGFFMWIGLTLGVLMFMESLSAFLHALRLHWVEFQNKFYILHGDGRKFMPYEHLKADDEEVA